MFNGSDDMCVKLRKVAKRHFFEVSKLFLTGKGFVILVGGRFICETALRRCVFAVIPLQTGALDVICGKQPSEKGGKSRAVRFYEGRMLDMQSAA
ncbi:MAG: hypothetical protein ACI4NF_03405 [Christensenellales bacterium]